MTRWRPAGWPLPPGHRRPVRPPAPCYRARSGVRHALTCGIMARWPTATTLPAAGSSKFVQLEAGKRLRIWHHGFYIADVRGADDLARWDTCGRADAAAARHVSPHLTLNATIMLQMAHIAGRR